MNNQTPSPAPDFGFIVNQPDLEPPKKRPTVLIFVGIGVVALLLGVAVLASVLSKTSKQESNVAQQQAATKAAQQYFSDISGGKPANAYDLLSADLQKNATKEQFTEYSNTVLNARFDLTKCTVVSPAQTANQTTSITYSCPTRDNKFNVRFSLGLINDTTGYKIKTYELKATPV